MNSVAEELSVCSADPFADRMRLSGLVRRHGIRLMLRILGSPKKLCNGWTRREMLRAGGLGLLGLELSDFFRLSELQASSAHSKVGKSFGRAKSCILLYLYGSPSQIETFDMKPEAPVEIRG